MELSKEQVDRKRKKWISAVLLLLIGLLLFFTLFSNTLQSVTLPKVRAEQAASGGIAYKLEGSGELQPVNQAELPNSAGWRVRQVLVKEGEEVKKGQRLVAYDSTSAERELEDELAQLEKLTIALEGVQDQFKLSMVEGNESATREVRRELATRSIDIAMQQRKIDGLKEQLNRQRELRAPFDGIVAKMNVAEGLVSTGQPDVVITNRDLGYLLEIMADKVLVDRLGLAVKQPIELRVAAEGEQPARTLEGIIDEIADAGTRIADPSEGGGGASAIIRQKELRIHVADAALKGGEQVSVKLERASSGKGWLIPNEAVHREGEKRFIFKVEQQRGALGNVFVARKVPIDASESTDRETMIPADWLYEGELIILESSEPLQDGNRIRLQ
ncbi:biotin/lipoyl-binding protein [Paenibacillus sp. 1011MAR3C5]|uniref:efflux RND transporter periplasmic adaptor subunit n=1 Tax=Paenibacillus sp. 1011MAR3C5 TaxID=1675787 RepID=UPI000E6C1728|nr:HlyD family efflux transporter periplasmic adaptor subunit [Paenibacillus sp. 1011MAR3C5]RJE88326.1 biotin/lipoyl-binding protein [Paenibacillus sp. 1011MAR3C5]